MPTTINPMIAELEAAFVDFDAANAAKSLAWAKGRVVALREWKETEEAKQMARQPNGSWGYYGRMFAICGGKAWFQLFNYTSVDHLEAPMAKNSKAIADKRNATIVRKLTKMGVTNLGGLVFTYTNDGGYNGTFSFEGAAIEIRTIVAGGYNIQCLHQRTLVYVNNKRL